VHRPHLVIDAEIRWSFNSPPGVNKIRHVFACEAPTRDAAPAGNRLSLRFAVLVIVGLSLLGWGIMLILALGLFGGL
jgi:hypothetical protein